MTGEMESALGGGLLGSSRRALDIGCGAGLEAVWLAGRGLEVLGVDSSPVALDLARQRADRARLDVDWRLGSALALPVPDGAMDLALDRGCLHVIERRHRRRYAKEVARVLRPGGTFVVWGARADDDELGLIGVSARELNRLFEPRGFLRAVGCPEHLTAMSGPLEAGRFTLRAAEKRSGTSR